MQIVYEQHARALPIQSNHRSQFIMQEQGDLFIIGIDLNDPVQRHDHTQFFGELHMKEVILTINSETFPPTTNIRNVSNYPIDGIWYSLGLTALRGGYSKFKEGLPSDHRDLWVEF